MGVQYITVKENDVEGYSPPGHGHTTNYRLLGPHNGSNNLEFIIGKLGKEGHAEAHVHASFDQCLYILEGHLKVTGDGPEVVLKPGELVFFPQGASHKLEVVSDEVKCIVLYGPPRELSAEAVSK